MRATLAAVLVAVPATLIHFSAAAQDMGMERPKFDTSDVAAVVTFGIGKAALSMQARVVLDGVIEQLNAQLERQVELAGHTDDSGAEVYNSQLSDQRAEAVRAYLVGHGIDAARLSAIGYGPYQPVDDNGTAAGRARNRRVEVRIPE